MARKRKRSTGTKKVITAKQKSARRKNIAVARSKKKKGGKKVATWIKKPLTRAQRKAKGLPTNMKEVAKKKAAIKKKYGVAGRKR